MRETAWLLEFDSGPIDGPIERLEAIADPVVACGVERDAVPTLSEQALRALTENRGLDTAAIDGSAAEGTRLRDGTVTQFDDSSS